MFYPVHDTLGIVVKEYEFLGDFMATFNQKLLETVISEMNNLHLYYSECWLRETNGKALNLKTKRVDHVVQNKKATVDFDFLKLLEDYITFCNMELTTLNLEYDYRKYDVRTRIKQKDSIVNKLFHYTNPDSNHEKGKVSLNKCLNDIFGARIIFDDLNHDDENFQEIIDSYVKKYKLRSSIQTGEYSATHLYFRNRNNKLFPWELQIWSSEHLKSNEKSHEEHKNKRDYIKWPEVYKNSHSLERRDL